MQMQQPRQPVTKCSQCGLLHPPLKGGATCPNAKDVCGVDLTYFFGQMKNICKSQIEIKQIKDHDKLFKHIIIEVMKSLENYKE